MNFFPIKKNQFDLSGLLEVPYKMALQTKKDYLSMPQRPKICLEEFRGDIEPGVFLMPLFINWRCPLPEGDLMASTLLSIGLKKEIRRSLRYAKVRGLSCNVENPLRVESFEKFRDFYGKVMEEKGYETILKPEYYQRHRPEDLYLLSLLDSAGQILGGMIVNRLSQSKLSTHFKAALPEKNGYHDLIMTEALYRLAATLGVKTLYYGKDFNLRGLDSKKPSLFFYKLRWGYRPFISWNLPTAYVDLRFLSERDISHVFFLSVVNRDGIGSQRDYQLVLNFVLGKTKIDDMTQSLEYLSKNYNYGVNVYDSSWRVLYGK